MFFQPNFTLVESVVVCTLESGFDADSGVVASAVRRDRVAVPRRHVGEGMGGWWSAVLFCVQRHRFLFSRRARAVWSVKVSLDSIQNRVREPAQIFESLPASTSDVAERSLPRMFAADCRRCDS